jgi:hypothetical protein
MYLNLYLYLYIYKYERDRSSWRGNIIPNFFGGEKTVGHNTTPPAAVPSQNMFFSFRSQVRCSQCHSTGGIWKCSSALIPFGRTPRDVHFWVKLWHWIGDLSQVKKHHWTHWDYWIFQPKIYLYYFWELYLPQGWRKMQITKLMEKGSLRIISSSSRHW